MSPAIREKALRIGELAARSGVSRDTLRYYERFGLLPRPERTQAGYRLYTERALMRLRVILNARRFGFTLLEIRGFLETRESGGAPCRQVRAAAERRLSSIEAQLAELHALRDAMRDALARWDERLSRTADGTPARLLEDEGM